MRKFLLSVFLFGLLLVPMVGLIPLTYLKEKASYYRSLHLPEGKSVVICGHSHDSCGFNPAYFPEMHNLSNSGCPLPITIYKSMDILEANRNREITLLLDITPNTARANDSMFKQVRFGSGKFTFIASLHNPTAPFPLEYVVSSMRNLLSHKVSSAGGFDPRISQPFIVEPERIREYIKDAVKCHNSREPFSIEDPYFMHMRKLIQLAKTKYKANVVLVTTPIHRDYREQLIHMNSFSGTMNELTSLEQVKWLNYVDLEMPSDEYWADANHLNLQGSVIFSKRIREDWRNLRLADTADNE